jgi:hypothetical protein
VSGNDNCDHVVPSTTAFLREDVRPTASAPDAQHAVVVRRFRLAPPPTDTRSKYEREQQSALEERPLIIALRI